MSKETHPNQLVNRTSTNSIAKQRKNRDSRYGESQGVEAYFQTKDKQKGMLSNPIFDDNMP